MTEDEIRAKREAIFRDLPPGTEPFVISNERLLELDLETRNAIVEEQIFRQGHTRIRIDCPIHRTRMCTHCINGVALPDLKGQCKNCGGTGRVMQNAPLVHGCKHVLNQDLLHPDGIVYTPRLYYVCLSCWDLIERKRFDFNTEIQTTCWYCVQAEAYRIVRIDPTLLVDLVTPKQE